MIKQIFIILFIYFFILIDLNAQWNWVNPKPENYSASKIIFTDDTTGFIFNAGGSLIKTIDRGINWKLVKRFGSMYLLDIHDSTAVVAGNTGVIYVSHNNCNSWQLIIAGIGAITGIDIVSRDTIFLTSNTALYKSFDRGITWQIIPVPSGTTIQSFEFVDSKLGFIGKANRSILKTVDGGTTWTETAIVNYSPSAILSIKFLNRDTGYSFRDHNHLLKTTDGGQTWTETNSISDDILAMSFPSDSIGYLAGESGAMFRTRNAGISWQWISPLQGRYAGYNINSMHFINKDTGFATGQMGRIIKTFDGGTNWVDYSPLHEITDFSFPDVSTGYASRGKLIHKTIDGGKTWNALALSPGIFTYSAFEKVYFTSPDTGFVTSSEYAFVHKTNDGGQTWSSVNPTGYYGYLKTSDISFCSDSIGFINLTSSSGYYIAKTKDKGKTWKGIDSARFSGEIIRKIHFLNEKIGYGLRYSQLYKTTDSAKNWTLLLDNNSTQFTSLYFLNQRIGLVADDYNFGFRRTTDSGRTWTTIPLPYNDRVVLSIKFINGAIGYATCSSGSIYQSADSGATWALYGKTPYECNNVKTDKTGLVYFGGAFGTIVSASTNYIIYPDYKCIGSSFSFFSDIMGLSSYQWQISSNNGQSFSPIINDGIHTGFSTNNLTVSYMPASFRNYKYRCLVDAVNYSKEFQVKFQSRFTGSIDDNWHNPGNWSCTTVPDAETDVLIGKGSVSIETNATVRSLTLLFGAALNIAANYNLNILH